MPSKGFTVDTDSRNDVIAFWHAVYQASEGYENRIQWTGNLNATDHVAGKGTVSDIFVKDVERRINFLRAMAGSPAHVSVNTGSKIVISASDPHQAATNPNTTKAEATQTSAYMIARAYQAGITWPDPHDPPTSTLGWTGAGWNATKKSNITQGYFGPGAINAYAQENDSGTTGSDNSAVGHRRWLLLQNAGDFATGDTPGLYDPSASTNTMQWRLPTNSLYVVQRKEEEIVTSARFAMYPNAGFFPAQLNTRWWSVSHPNADFSTVATANIRMYNAAGARIGTAMKSNASIPGDPTLSWDVVNAARVTSVTEDTKFRVVIDNFKINGVPQTLDYTVTLFNPDQLTSNQSLAGSSTVPSTGSANYHFTTVPHAEGYEAGVFSVSNTSWTETAEAVTDTVVPNVSGTYNFRSQAIPGVNPPYNPLAGSFSYRLTHPVRLDIMTGGVPEQGFQLKREIIANSDSAKLTFLYRRGYMGPGSTLAVEYSADGGVLWNTLGTPIVGNLTTDISDTTAKTWEGNFPASSSPFLVRFRYYRSSSAAAFIHNEGNNSTIPTGIFIDSITTSGCSWLDLKQANPLPADATRFTLNAASAGLAGSIPNGTEYQLRLRTKLGNRWFPYGPSKTVNSTINPILGFAGWLAYEVPNLVGGFEGSHTGDGIPNGIKYGFMMDPLVPSPPIVDTIRINVSRAKAPGGVGEYISISRAANGIRDGVTAEWSDSMLPGSWSSDGVELSYSDADKTATAIAPAGSGRRFLRWKVAAP